MLCWTANVAFLLVKINLYLLTQRRDPVGMDLLLYKPCHDIYGHITMKRHAVSPRSKIHSLKGQIIIQ
jgi:hypothetical protein